MVNASHDNASGVSSSIRFTTGVRNEKYTIPCTVSDMNIDTPDEHISNIGTIRQIVI